MRNSGYTGPDEFRLVISDPDGRATGSFIELTVTEPQAESHYTLEGNVDMAVIDLSSIDSGSLDEILLTGPGTTLSFTLQDLIDITDEDNSLMISGDNDDTVTSIGQGWLQEDDQVIDGETYDVFTSGLATLLVDADINQTIT